MLAAVAIGVGSMRGSKKKAEVALPPPILAKGPPGFRQSKTDYNLSPQYFDSLWPAGHRDSSNSKWAVMTEQTWNG